MSVSDDMPVWIEKFELLYPEFHMSRGLSNWSIHNAEINNNCDHLGTESREQYKRPTRTQLDYQTLSSAVS